MAEEKVTSRNQLCGLCDENTSKYCCPRCEVFYCSLDCYKSEKHIECSESFYRDCVNEELASHHVDDESKRKMIDILNRMNNKNIDDQEQVEESLEDIDEEVDSDDEGELDLHERIKDLNLDNADALWDVLTEDERNEFEALVSKGEVGSIMPQWEPWWTYRKEMKLIENIDKDSNKEEEALKKCPPLKQVPNLKSLTTVQPSPNIKFNITNVIASYVFVMRYFNGELEPLEGASYLLSICNNLNTNTNFNDAATAVESTAQKCLQSELIETDEISLKVMRHDTLMILQGPSQDNRLHYCKAALSDVHKIFKDVKSATKTSASNDTVTDKNVFSKKFPEHKMCHLPNLEISQVKKCIKKLEYYLSFLECFDMELE